LDERIGRRETVDSTFRRGAADNPTGLRAIPDRQSPDPQYYRLIAETECHLTKSKQSLPAGFQVGGNEKDQSK
jgi:hypothetical protein